MFTAKTIAQTIAAVSLLAITATAVHSQGGLETQDGSLSSKSAAAPRPCAVIEKFTASFERKLDDFVMNAATDTFVSPPEAVAQALSNGNNPYLEEMASRLAADSPSISADLANRVATQIHPYLDRVSIKLCQAAVHALDQPDPGLGGISKRGAVRRALCTALSRYFSRVQDRITSVIEYETRTKLASMVPTIPLTEAALMGPGEKRRIESELAWFVDTVAFQVADTMDDSVGNFYDRIRARYCN